MPDILIRGVALPKYGCAGCYFKTGKYCGIISKNENVEEYSLRAERHPDCPIHELPPHGDLIDRRELLSTVMQVVTKFPADNIAAIEHLDLVSALLRGATVVVPAEREGET